MYVASTRARESLTLTYPGVIKRKGYTFQKEASRFITTIIRDDSEEPATKNHRAIEELLHDDLYGLDHEEAWLLYLNKHSHPIGKEMISKGTLDRTAIDSRTIMRQALLHNAAAIVILHNHPSGTSRPSQHDIFFTNKLRQACVLMDIKLEDHIIVGEDDFYSFLMEKSYRY